MRRAVVVTLGALALALPASAEASVASPAATATAKHHRTAVTPHRHCRRGQAHVRVGGTRLHGDPVVARASAAGVDDGPQPGPRDAAVRSERLSGRVPGTHTWHYSYRESGPDGDGSYSRFYSEDAKTKIAGHTTDDGDIRDYDLDMRYPSRAASSWPSCAPATR